MTETYKVKEMTSKELQITKGLQSNFTKKLNEVMALVRQNATVSKNDKNRFSLKESELMLGDLRVLIDTLPKFKAEITARVVATILTESLAEARGLFVVNDVLENLFMIRVLESAGITVFADGTIKFHEAG